MLRTRICELLGIEHAVFSAPMGPDLSGPELVSAVSGAGGLGILQAQLDPPELLRRKIRNIRERTTAPFGVNFILHFPFEEGLELCIEERVPVISFFWGEPAPLVERVHRSGLKVLHQVGSVSDALRAADAGVDVVIAQGAEAGGHLAGDVSTLALVPRIVDAVHPLPVAAAGGIGDARGVVAALALGAEAAVLGTRFLATEEARAHPEYKARLIAANESETTRTTLFDREWPNAPHRVVCTEFVRDWLGKQPQKAADATVIGQVRIAGREMPLTRFMGFPPNADATGSIESMSLLAGQSVGLVEGEGRAADVVRELVEGAGKIVEERLTRCV